MATNPGVCKALRVQGKIRTRAGRVIETSSLLDGAAWLELADGAEVVVRHGPSGREVLLAGPGLALPCRGGLEHFLLSRGGTFKSQAGTGVRPGADVWIATPFGSARYADATFEARLSPDRWELRVRNGRVWVDASAGQRLPGNGMLASGRSVELRGATSAAGLARGCERKADLAQESASVVFSSSGPERGASAARQLAARRQARAACFMAAAALEPLSEGVERARLADQVARAEERWKAIPERLTEPRR